ncbi:hypothetical protein [Agathobaculum hominis]
MGIIKSLRKKYWRDAIISGGQPLAFSCDGMTAIPKKAYALFTEKELEEIYEEKRKIRERIKQKIAELD